ncbi:DUF4199 domain-containing protein [Lunatimonas salinarum]|uniref:DUF4199 domain-containing protein n=1 Tax=Lunatimonas salinarum TaxID=1774590 RepID=UPI001ADF116D|nr:DUF4199 domain-containing protein [Lunatimonas salinarum]
MENRLTNSPSQAAFKSGLYLGLTMFILTLLAYFVDYTILVSFWFGIVILALFFGLILFFGFQYRKEAGGYLEYGPAFMFSFVTLLVSGLIGLIGNLILYQVIDPQLPQMLVDAQLENMLNMMDRFGAGDSISGDQLDEIRVGIESNFSISGQVKSFGIGLIVYAIMALILAAILKKRDKSLDY